MKEDNRDEQRETVRDKEEQDDPLMKVEEEILMQGLKKYPPPTREELREMIKESVQDDLVFNEERQQTRTKEFVLPEEIYNHVPDWEGLAKLDGLFRDVHQYNEEPRNKANNNSDFISSEGG